MLECCKIGTNTSITNLTLANMYMHVKNYKKAKEHIEEHKTAKNITTKLTGKTAKVKYFCNIENDFLALEVADTNTNKELLETDKLKYIDFYASPLSLDAQEILLTELEYIQNTENDEEYKKEKITAYIDRLKYAKNTKHPLFSRLVYYYNTYIDTKEYYYIEQDLQCKNACDFTRQYNLPVKYAYEMQERLAHVFCRQFRYENALQLYKALGDVENMIRCYVGLNRESEAIAEAKNTIQTYKEQIRNRTSNMQAYCMRHNVDKQSVFYIQYKIYESYLLLATLENKSEYFDLAYDTIQHSEPQRLKGLYYFASKDYKMAAECFCKALEINRTEKILFSYGCTLIEMKEYKKAIQVYQEFLLFDDKNTKALLNLTNCYFAIQRYEEGLAKLQTVIKYTQRKELIDLYKAMCIKHNIEMTGVCSKV